MDLLSFAKHHIVLTAPSYSGRTNHRQHHKPHRIKSAPSGAQHHRPAQPINCVAFANKSEVGLNTLQVGLSGPIQRSLDNHETTSVHSRNKITILNGRVNPAATKSNSTGSTHAIGVGYRQHSSAHDIVNISRVAGNFSLIQMDSDRPRHSMAAMTSSGVKRPLQNRPVPSMLLPTARVRMPVYMEDFLTNLRSNKENVVAMDPRSPLILTAGFIAHRLQESGQFHRIPTSRPGSANSADSDLSTLSAGTVTSLLVGAGSPEVVDGGRESIMTTFSPSDSAPGSVTSGYLENFANPLSLKAMLMRAKNKRKRERKARELKEKQLVGLYEGVAHISCPECRRILAGYKSVKDFWDWLFSTLSSNEKVSIRPTLPNFLYMLY